MDLSQFIQKYGTETASRLLKKLAADVDDGSIATGHTVDVATVAEVADDLHAALQAFRAANEPGEF